MTYRHMVRRQSNGLEFTANFILLLIAVEVVDQWTPLRLDYLGIFPRTLVGLPGILFSPLLHGGFRHLAANLIPLAILLPLLFSDPRYRPGPTLVSIWLASGFGTWLIGRSALHIGSSSIIFGLAAYLICAGIYMRCWRAFFISLLVFLAFGGIFLGALPQSGPISWEGHLCGAIAGWWQARKQHALTR